MIFSRFSKLRKNFAFFLAGLATTIGIGLITPTPVGAVPWTQLLFNGVQLLQLSNVSAKQKVELGREIDQQVRSNYRISTNEKVTRIGQRVAAASDCAEYPFHFSVVQDKSINAFSTTGGYVYVHTGLLNAVDNEDQLAAVLGHEIGHICNNDLIKKLRQAQLAQGAASLAGLDRSTVASAAYKLAVDLPNSRDAEYNADDKGLRYIERAGYNPNAMPAFLSKLVSQRSTPTFLSDHPGAKERISILQRKIAAGQ